MKGLNRAEESSLRTIAERHGYTASTGPHVGKGSASQLMQAIISGEVATVLLGDEDRRWFIQWLESQSIDNPLYTDIPSSVAAQLRDAAQRDD